MDVNISDVLQLGAVSVIFIFAVREFFVYLKDKKAMNNDDSGNEKIVAILEKLGSNHLTHVQAAIEDGNRELTKTIHDDNMRMIELLGEISGRLSK